jgi:hypothetical protein
MWRSRGWSARRLEVEKSEDAMDDHYEEEFEFPLWKLIKQYAERNDVSYSTAYAAVSGEYAKTIRYRDTEFEDAEIAKRQKEIAEAAERERK